MAEDIATLGIEVRTSGAKDAARDLLNLENAGARAENSLSGIHRAAVEAAKGLAALKLVNIAKDAALAHARFETLGVVMVTVGRNAGYTAAEVEKYSQSVKKMGITMTESRSVIVNMVQAQLDLSKASQLARVAQDAAVIGNINSSEALNRLIYGVKSAQVEILRNIGINVNFEQSYKKLGEEIGKSAANLTEAEKAQARMNAVLEAGQLISGTYSASMDTASKKIGSLKRYVDDAAVSLGEKFNKPLNLTVDGLTVLAKNADTVATVIGVTAIAAIGKYSGALITSVAAKVKDAAASQAAAAAELALARAEEARAAAQARAALTAGQLTAATAAQAAAASRAAAAQASMVTSMTVARGAIAALGGPIGVMITLLGSAAFAWSAFGDSAEKSALKAGGAADWAKRKLAELDAQQKYGTGELATALEALEAAQNRLRSLENLPQHIRNSPYSTVKEQIGQALEDVERLGALVRRLQDVQTPSGGGIPKTVSTLSDYLKDRRSVSQQLKADLEEEEKAFRDATQGLVEGSAEYVSALESHNRAIAAIREKYAKKGGSKERDELADLQMQLAGLDQDFYKQLQTLEKLGKGTDEYREAVERLIAKQPFAAKLSREQADADKEAAKAAEETVRALDTWYQTRKQASNDLDSQIQQEEDYIKSLGLSAVAAKELAAQKNDLAAAAQTEYASNVRAASAYAGPLRNAYLQAALDADRLADKYRELASLNRESGMKASVIEAAQEAQSEWEKTSDFIAESLTDALMRGFEDGKGFAENFRDTLRNMFKTLILRPIIQPITQGASGAIMQAAGAAGGGGSGGMGLLNNASSLYSAYNAATSGTAVVGTGFSPWTMTAAPVYEGGSLVSGATYGSAAGAGMGLLGGAMLGYQLTDGNPIGTFAGGALGAAGYGAIAGGLTGAAAGTGAIAGAASGAITALAAIPVWGWIALAAAAILGSNQKGGTPHMGAAVFSGPEGTISPRTYAETMGLYADPADADGFGENDFYRRRQQGVADALTPIAEQAANVLNSTLKSFGLTGGAQVGLAFSTDGEDKSRGRFSVIDEAGREIAEFRKKYAKDASKGIQQFTDDLGAGLRDALVAADLPGWADDILEALGDDPGLQGLNDALAQIEALRSAAESLGPALGLAEEAFVSVMQKVGGDLIASYLQTFYSDAERAEIGFTNIGRALEDLGFALPDSKEGFRALVESIDTSTESGQGLYAKLLQLAPAFAETADLAATLVDASEETSRAAEDAAKAAQKAWEEAQKAAVAAATENVQRLTSLSNALRGALDGMRIDTVEDDINRRRDAQAQLGASLAIARASGGRNLPEVEAISGALSEVAKPSVGLFSSFTDYARDFYQTANTISSLAELTDAALSVEERTLAFLKGQSDTELAWHVEDLDAFAGLAEIGDVQTALMETQNATLEAMATSLVDLPEAIISGRLPRTLSADSPINLIPYDPNEAANAMARTAGIDHFRLTGQVLEGVPGLQTVIDALVAEQERLKQQHVPGFASGGTHMGGGRIVGERGWEFEVTPASHIFNQNQLATMFGQDELVAEVRALRAEVANLRAASEATARHTHSTSKTLDRVTHGNDALRTEVVS